MNIIYILISILLAIDSIFIRFRLLGMSFDRWLEFILFIVFLKPYLEELRTNSFFRKWNLFILLFAVIQLLINFKLAIAGEIEFSGIYTEFLKCISYIVYTFLFLLVAKKNVRYVNVILIVYFLICVFAILQHPLSPVASQVLEVKKFLYTSTSTDIESIEGRLDKEEAYIAGGYSNRFRLAGPYSSAINFSYFAISAFGLALYMFLRYRHRYYLVLLGTILIASVLTQTRSLLLAEICLIMGYMFFMPTKIRGLYKLLIIGGGFVSILIIYAGKDLLIPQNSRLTQISSSGEEDSRPYLWLTGIRAVIQHPFGITKYEYQQVRNEMAIITGKPYVLYLAPHNGLINIGFNYSILGYLIFFFFVAFLLRYINSLRSKDSLLFKLILLGYLIHCCFHNKFIFVADYNILMIIMLICLVYEEQHTMTREKKQDIQAESASHFISGS